MRQPEVRKRRAILAGSIGLAVLLIVCLWAERRQLAGNLIDRRLAAAGVPAVYRLRSLGPTAQVIETVRVGDPTNPDFTARRILLRWRYRLGWPELAIEIEGGRLRAAWHDGRLSLGAIDRLLPQTGGRAALPDLDATLRDTRMTLATPLGMVGGSIEGSGNLARSFSGLVRAVAPSLTTAGCTGRGTEARLAVRTANGRPHFVGPIDVASLHCPALQLDPGQARIDLRLSPTFDTMNGTVGIAGFGGASGYGRFAGVRGTIGIAGGAEFGGSVALTAQKLQGPRAGIGSVSITGRYRYAATRITFAGRVGVRELTATPSVRGAIASAATTVRQTPLGPIATKLDDVMGRLAFRSDIDAPVSLATGRGAFLSIDQATLHARTGATAIISARIAGDSRTWQATARFGGAGLPQLAVQAEKGGRDAPVDAMIRLSPYRAGTAMVALTPLRVIVGGQGARFATVATLDGPLGSGRIEGLTMPLAGRIDPAGGVALGQGCATIRYRLIRLNGLVLDPAGITLCGAPFISQPPRGALHVDATTRDLLLTGRSGAAPLVLRAATLRLTEVGFVGTGLAARIGAPDDLTRLDIRSLDGRFRSGTLDGRFTDAAGAIGPVPLALSGATGQWRSDDDTLHLKGALQVADRAAAARFLPLAAQDVALDLRDGRISATGTLRAPTRNVPVARVVLRHDIASGSGGATLDVPGITFARGALQPEMLTPLTLGVIANVAGTVQGNGRIDWTSAGTTSSGTFATDRLDLAAAFGPVAGISGTIRFTDLLGLVTAPHQEARIAEINPGVAVANGVAQYQLIGDNRVRIEDARWPFAGGTLVLDPATLDFGQTAERRLTFRVAGLDAAAFIQQLDFPNISATGTFDGRLPMVFDQTGGRIEDGALVARGPGTLAYVGELSNAQLGTMGKLAFDALKAIRYSALDIALDGSLDGEVVTRVRFDGVRQATGDRGMVARMIRNLPFRFNIRIQAPFRGLVGSARSYANPALLLQSAHTPSPIKPPPPIQPAESAPVR